MKRIILLSLLLVGCDAKSKPEMVPVEIEYNHPVTGDVVKETIMREKHEQVDRNTIKHLNSQLDNVEYFCNGGMLWAKKYETNRGFTYPVVKHMDFNGRTPTYKTCDVNTGKILN